MRLRVMITEVTSQHTLRQASSYFRQSGRFFTTIINSLASHETNAESIIFVLRFSFSFLSASFL